MNNQFVNMVAITALRDYPKDVKDHVTYGWQIRNVAGEDDANPNRNDTYFSRNIGYSLSEAVMIAADALNDQPDNDIWVEPCAFVQAEEDEDICKWIVRNNENMK